MVWPRARFAASTWGSSAGNGGSVHQPLAGSFDGIMFGGMFTRPCVPNSMPTMPGHRDASWKTPSHEDDEPEDMFMMPNDLWGFSAGEPQPAGPANGDDFLGAQHAWASRF